MAFEKKTKYRTQRDNLENLRRCVEGIKRNVTSGTVNQALVLTALANILTGVTTNATEAKQDNQITLLTTIDASIAKNNLETLKAQSNDLSSVFVYLDAGLPDERVSTITYSGTTSPATPNVVKTFVYGGGAGAYFVTSITLS